MGRQNRGLSTPLYIEALEDGLIVLGNFTGDTYSYSYDAKTWTSYTNVSVKSLDKGERIYFRGTALQATMLGYIATQGGKAHVGGNAMSLIYNADFANQNSLVGYDWAFVRCFQDNTNIESVDPTLLPATTLSALCYAQMFMGCTSLKAGPILPAPVLTQNCYYQMYTDCTSLNYIKMLATTPYDASTDMENWTSGVSSTSGTFVKHPNNTWIATNSVSGIPSGWTIQTATS